MIFTDVGEENKIEAAPDPDVKAMIEAGVHIGHTKNKRHPMMEPYIWTVRGNISIIDVVKTKDELKKACDFLGSVAVKNGLILFVGTRPAAKKIIEETALSLNMPYVIERWIGGTLTNFKVISKRIETLSDLEKKKSAGELEKYTKKEQVLFEREITRLRKDFNGLRALNRLPAAVFVVNIPHDELAVREARRMRIPVVALADTNADIRMITYPIPSNDDALPAIRYMLGRIRQCIEQTAKEVAAKESAAKEAAAVKDVKDKTEPTSHGAN